MNSPKAPTVHARSRNDVDRWADLFLRRHYPALLEVPGRLDVMHMLNVLLHRDYGVELEVVDSLPVGVEGVTEPPNVLMITEAVYDGIRQGEPRARFTGAHEAVHAVLHLGELNSRFESSGGGPKLHRRSEIPSYVDPEWQANRGAAGLLMPARMVWPLVENEPDPTTALRRVFGTSLQAASFRVDDARQERLWRPGR